MSEPAVRIDKWLWAVRVYKTRSLAASACRHGDVTVAGQKVKPSREVKVDDVIHAKAGDITRTIKVLKPLDRRVGAAVAKDFAEDQTPPEEYEKKREPNFQPLFFRPKGTGRPTKKDRRKLNEFGSQL